MESNSHLASLMEMSESQIDALLKYDSPPETPSQMAHMMLSNEDCNNSKIQSESLNNTLLNNREQLVTQMESQIDFPIFVNDKENLSPAITLSSFEMQANDTEDSILMFSQNTSYITLSGCKQSNNFFNDKERTKNIRCSPCGRNDELSLESNKEIYAKNKFNKSVNKNNEDLEEMDDIFKCIDLDSISKLNESHLNSDVSRFIQLDPNDEILASCPVLIQDTNSLKSSTSTGNKCNEENSTSLKVGSSNEETTTDFISVANFEETFNNESCDFSNEKEVSSEIERNNASLIPFSVKQLYDIIKADNSDLAFIYALSAQLCQDRVPMECFVTLKMTLLLSLVSIGNDPDRPPLSVVAMANDTYMTDYLMVNIGKLATRFVGPIVDTKTPTSCNDWYEADPMLLAQGGVYYAGDWNRLKLKRAECIFKIIECSTIPVEKSAFNYPLESAIWTHWHSYKYNSKDQQTFNKFLKIFGIPVFVSDDSHEALVDYTLEQSSVRVFESTIDNLSINEDDMRKFLVYVSQCKVNVTPEAATLLKNYFVASRCCTQDCLTKQSYIALKQFAESFCKLSMRNEVSADDALAAIILCEHSIENIFSFRNDSPPHFGSFTSVGAVDEYVIDFKKWLDSFLNKISKN